MNKIEQAAYETIIWHCRSRKVKVVMDDNPLKQTVALERNVRQITSLVKTFGDELRFVLNGGLPNEQYSDWCYPKLLERIDGYDYVRLSVKTRTGEREYTIRADLYEVGRPMFEDTNGRTLLIPSEVDAFVYGSNSIDYDDDDLVRYVKRVSIIHSGVSRLLFYTENALKHPEKLEWFRIGDEMTVKYMKNSNGNSKKMTEEEYKEIIGQQDPEERTRLFRDMFKGYRL